MAKVSGTHRTTITIPNALKARMDKVREPVNWSALACAAFEAKLGEIAARKEKKNMEDVVSRLRASKRASDDTISKEGYSAGQRWAKNHAEAAELERIEALLDKLDGDAQHGRDDYFDDETYNQAYSLAEVFYSVLSGIAPHMDRDAAYEFWVNAAGESAAEHGPPAPYIRSFAEGALDVWEQVKTEL